MITIEFLQTLCPNTKNSVLEKYVDPLNDVTDHFEMNTPERLAGFLSQIVHESNGFNSTKENLNYSAAGLLKTFKKYFPDPNMAAEYARKPEKIANRVYANRMSNGDEASGDGFKFCGRGLIQLTGRDNYTRFAEALGITLEECVSYMETPEGAASSAGWFWDTRDLNTFCDDGDFTGLTKKINGGTNGIEERQQLYTRAIDLLNE
jgi:putative chitinase